MQNQESVSTIIEVFSKCLYAFGLPFFCRLLYSVVPRKDGKFWTAVIGVSCYFLFGMTIFTNDMFNVTLDLLWFTALMLVAFKGRVVPKLASVAIFYPLIISLNFLIQDLLGVVYFSLDATLFASIFCHLSDAFLHILFWYVLYRLFRQRLFDISRLFDQNTWILLGAVCLASLVSITTVIYYAPAESYKIWLCALACIITNIGSLCLAGYFSNSIRLEAERNNLKLQQEYYEELERNQTEIRKLRHDMNHHLSVIKDLFYSENRMEAEEYFKKVESQIAVQNRVFCKNSIVNAVLNAKCSQAAGQGIDCFFHVDLHNIQSIDSVSLCSLFSNTLDNAIEASLKVRDPGARKISVKARSTDSGYFSYEISNQKANPIVEKNGHILSDKKDAKSHGLGIRNIREIIDRYNGTLDISYTEDTFTVTMLIRL